MEKEKTQISLTLAENESVIRTWCENCDDIQIRPMKLGKTGGTGALLIYVEVAVSCVMLKDSVIGKLLNRLMEVPEADIPGVLSENQLGISERTPGISASGTSIRRFNSYPGGSLGKSARNFGHAGI